MMNGYSDPEKSAKEFVRKTLILIEQYDATPSSENKFEITMRINCLLGLIIVPQQFLAQQSVMLVTSGEESAWGIRVENISYGVYEAGVLWF